MRLVTIATTTAMMVIGLTLTPVFAGPKGSGKPPVAKVAKVNQAPKTLKAPKAVTTTRAPRVAKAPKLTKVSSTTKVAKTPKVAKAPKAAKVTTSTASTASTSTSTSTTTTPTTTPKPIDFTASPVGQKMEKNSALRSKVETRLTAAGYEGTVYQAAYGFKNQGQFIAATNVAKNLGVSFDQIKLQMTGLAVNPVTGAVTRANLVDGKVVMVAPELVTNPAPTTSLGGAIKTVKSGVNATAEATTATAQANTEIQATTTTAAN